MTFLPRAIRARSSCRSWFRLFVGIPASGRCCRTPSLRRLQPAPPDRPAGHLHLKGRFRRGRSTSMSAIRSPSSAVGRHGHAVPTYLDRRDHEREYWTAPDGRFRNSARTTVDNDGNVWVGNRYEATGGQGSVVHVGLLEKNQCVEEREGRRPGVPGRLYRRRRPGRRCTPCPERPACGRHRHEPGLIVEGSAPRPARRPTGANRVGPLSRRRAARAPRSRGRGAPPRTAPRRSPRPGRRSARPRGAAR